MFLVYVGSFKDTNGLNSFELVYVIIGFWKYKVKNLRKGEMYYWVSVLDKEYLSRLLATLP